MAGGRRGRRHFGLSGLLAIVALAAAASGLASARAAPSGEAAFAHVQHLAGVIGPRPAGTASDRQAADYLALQLRQYGYLSGMHAFQFPFFEARRVEVAQQIPVARTLPSAAMVYSAPTGPAGVEGELVPVGLGRPGDYAGRQVEGAIALIERGEITFFQKVETAASRGALAAVIYDNQPQGITAGTLTQRSRIPAVAISRDEGTRLQEAAKAGRVRLRLLVDTHFETRSSSNVVATKRGTSRPDEIVVVGAHYDSVPGSPGANDNASGVAAVLEAARVVAGTGTPRTVQFVLFSGEELGLFGSAAYASEHRAGVVAMVNLDMVGWGARLMIGNSPGRDETAVNVALRVAEELGIPVTRLRLAASDHASFERVGVPAVLLHRGIDPYYHRPTDVPSVVDPRNLEEAARLVVGLLLHPAFPTAVVDRGLIGMPVPELPVFAKKPLAARVR